MLGRAEGDSLATAPWVVWDDALCVESTVTLGVQVGRRSEEERGAARRWSGARDEDADEEAEEEEELRARRRVRRNERM